MLHLTAPVRDRTAHRHDAAIVQAALHLGPPLMANPLTGRNALAVKVDGDFGAKSQEALRLFMSDKRLRGPVEVRPGGPVARALEAALPHRLRNLAAIETSNIVFIPERDKIGRDRALRHRRQQPGARRFADALGALARRVWQRMGLRLAFELAGIDERGARQIEIRSVGAEWLFAGAIRPARPRETPPVALERLRDLVLPLGRVEIRRGGRGPHILLTWNGERLLPPGAVGNDPALLARWALPRLANNRDRRALAAAARLLEMAARHPPRPSPPPPAPKLEQLQGLLKDPRAQKALGGTVRALSGPRVSAAAMEDVARFTLRETLANARFIAGKKTSQARKQPCASPRSWSRR